MKKLFTRACIVALATQAVSFSAMAEENDKGMGGQTYGNPSTPWTFPGVSAGSPVGFGAEWGLGYIGVGFQAQNRTQKANKKEGPDGNVGGGFGLGNATEYVGLEVGVDVDSIYNNKTGGNTSPLKTVFTRAPAFDHGGVSLKVHRKLDALTSVSIGRENVYQWGSPKYLLGSWYLAGSHVFILADENELASALTATVGVGTKRFQTADQLARGKNGVGFFGAAGLRVVKWASAIVDWTGSALNVGASFTPLGSSLLFISPTLADVAVAGANPGPRFAISVGYAYNFL